MIAGVAAFASRLSRLPLTDSAAPPANGIQDLGFSRSRCLARFVQETDRSVSYLQGENQ
jgi:hypothetical protein